MQALPMAFAGLAAYAQFIVYMTSRDTAQPTKIKKIPISPVTKRTHNPHDKSIWMSFEQASEAVLSCGEGYGVGFVITKDDPFFLLDVDHDWNHDTKSWSAHGQYVYQLMYGAAFELSVSQTGFHIIGSCKNFPEHISVTVQQCDMQLYSHSRFVALTGVQACGSIDFDCTEQFKTLAQYYFPAKSNQPQSSVEWSDQPRADWNGYADDEELIEHALRAKPLFGTKATFKDLWENNVNTLTESYPPKGSGFYDSNVVDSALIQHLAFWTGCNPQRILTLMYKSALVREKWDRPNYLETSILKCCQIQKKVYARSKETALVPVDQPQFGSFVTIEQQMVFFKGCVYVQDSHTALVPGGNLLTPPQFRATFGGYMMPLDPRNEKVTRNAWEAFTESQSRFKQWAHGSCFRPDLPPGHIDEEDGERLVNTWWPTLVKRAVGDTSLFTNHIAKILPAPRDQVIILSYMAACVQYPGVKFKWAPLLQGVEGNGKTLLAVCIACAIGWKYANFTNAQKLAERFNDWQHEKIFIGVDDIRISDSDQSTYEALKPIIDSERPEIEPKNLKKKMRRVCTNYFFTSNHKDAIRKTRNDRRFAVFYSAQQSLDDLVRDGMVNTDYFDVFVEWLQQKNGHAYVNELLATYEIPEEFNPATRAKRAPKTSSTEAAISQSLSLLEQEIMEAIEQGFTGFRRGWISSIYLTRLFEHIRPGRIPSHSKRHELLATLGYIPHPALKEGRVNNAIMPDGGKPRLFVLKGHESLELTNSAEVAKKYADDQEST